MVGSGILPTIAIRDAPQLAASAVHGMDFLRTWNCKHLADRLQLCSGRYAGCFRPPHFPTTQLSPSLSLASWRCYAFYENYVSALPHSEHRRIRRRREAARRSLRAFEFQVLFEIPASFGKPLGGYSAYLATDAGKAPIRDLTWKHAGDTIVLRWMVVPDAVWQLKTTEQMFAGARENMLTDESLKLVSERNYKVNDSPAHSFIFAIEGGRPEFQRMDYILTKPDLNIVMYSSPNKAALDDLACRKLFESLSVGSKAPKK